MPYGAICPVCRGYLEATAEVDGGGIFTRCCSRTISKTKFNELVDEARARWSAAKAARRTPVDVQALYDGLRSPEGLGYAHTAVRLVAGDATRAEVAAVIEEAFPELSQARQEAEAAAAAAEAERIAEAVKAQEAKRAAELEAADVAATVARIKADRDAKADAALEAEVRGRRQRKATVKAG